MLVYKNCIEKFVFKLQNIVRMVLILPQLTIYCYLRDNRGTNVLLKTPTFQNMLYTANMEYLIPFWSLKDVDKRTDWDAGSARNALISSAETL